MGKKVHTIHSLPPEAPWKDGHAPVDSTGNPFAVRMLDRVLGVQRPLVLAHVRSIRLRHPDATPDQLMRILERRYLATITTGGAAVGASAVVPGIGTGVTLALSGAETVGFMEATALYGQSIAEVHGIAVDTPDRARALVMTLMLGTEGVELLTQLGRQFHGGTGRTVYWGELVTKSLPRAAMGPVLDRLKGAFLHQLATRGSASLLGKALPFGVGAAIGGAGNHILGRGVIRTARKAFGPAPTDVPASIEPAIGAQRVEKRIADAARNAGTAIAHGADSLTRRLRPGGRRSVTAPMTPTDHPD